MSGSSLAPWAMKDDAHLVAHQIAEATDCIHQDPESILNCLREMPMEKIQKTVASLKSGRRFSGIFGPSADGVVILSDTHSAMGGARGRSGRSEELPTYDAIFGITGAEAAYQLSAAATYDGIDATERDVLLRSFIIETYRYHQTEIFLTLSNEYTDWERVIQHPLNLRDSVIEALSDAQFVAPAISLGDSVVSENRNTYFYVMDPVSIQVCHLIPYVRSTSSILITKNCLYASLRSTCFTTSMTWLQFAKISVPNYDQPSFSIPLMKYPSRDLKH